MVVQRGVIELLKEIQVKEQSTLVLVTHDMGVHANLANRVAVLYAGKNELSGGQAQRVLIARALITKPSLLVADEPVSMLDASLRMSIVNLFKQLKDKQQVSVLYITHDLTTAYYAADRIAVMLRGWIVESGPVEKVLGEPLHPYTQNLKNAIPEADPDKTWEGDASLAIMDTEEFTRTGCKYAGRCPAVMEICKHQVPSNYFVDGRAVKCFLYDDSIEKPKTGSVAMIG